MARVVVTITLEDARGVDAAKLEHDAYVFVENNTHESIETLGSYDVNVEVEE